MKEKKLPEAPKPKPPARPEAPPPSLKNTIDTIKKRKKMLDEL